MLCLRLSASRAGRCPNIKKKRTTAKSTHYTRDSGLVGDVDDAVKGDSGDCDWKPVLWLKSPVCDWMPLKLDSMLAMLEKMSTQMSGTCAIVFYFVKCVGYLVTFMLRADLLSFTFDLWFKKWDHFRFTH